MRTAITLTRVCAAATLVVFAAVARLHAQSPIGEVRVTPISDLRSGWLNGGAESPNGRFFVFRSYDSDTFLRYDRSTGKWASASGVSIGSQLRWSPDGKFLAFARVPRNLRERSVWVLPMDPSTGLPRGTARRISTSPGSWPAWSPDGRRIAFSVQDSVRFRLVTVPFNGGDEQVLYDDRGTGGDIAWSPDGKYLFAGHRVSPDTLISWLRVNAATKHVDTLPFGALRMLGYSADGKRVAHFDNDRWLIVISSADDGRTVQRVRVPKFVFPSGWSHSAPNSISAIQYITPSHVQRVSLPDGRIQSLTPIDSASLNDVVYSPGSRQIAFMRPVAGKFRLHVASADGSGLHGVGASGDIGVFAWSPSGREIAYAVGGPSGGIHVVEVGSGSDRELVRPNGGSATLGRALAWRSDGRAFRYIRFPRGNLFPEREVREVTLDGNDRRVTTVATPPSYAHFINDTLLLLKKGTGVDAVNLRTGALRSLYNGSMRGWNDFGVSADGSWLAFSADSDNGTAYPHLLSLTTGESRRIPYSLKGELATIFFHPDGRNLVASACITCQTGVEKWDVVLIPMNGEPARVLTGSEPSYKDFGNPQISADGRYVIFEAEQSYNTRVVTLHLPGKE